ncbi:transcriptional regulator [Actinoalloteichus sp. GBA129-24]|uniref:Transcriptional regulator n=1 Tax=Actinoalloteichus fjordicus TaxID=1612552 RepID=A0AAC9LEQ7_9PSEU|nr:transcriptional regulator [Actinoalloteichus fjordicus]APU21035.1 transcriptional regulator [Actinoalloteichus sp. GBA129-24]
MSPGAVPAPQPGDDELVTWWGLVIEGYHATQDRLMGEITARFGLAPASFDILIRLIRSPRTRLPMTRLAREAALTSGGFTKVADRLVAADLIRREPCSTDRRITYAVLTEHGRDVAERARAACAQILRQRVLEPLGPAASESLAQAMRTLRSANGDGVEGPAPAAGSGRS